MDQLDAIRMARSHLEADGVLVVNLVLTVARFIPGNEPLSATGRDAWVVFFQSRDADPDLHPNDIVVLVDAETQETRRVGLL
jgi:hypothetical protein